MIGKTRTPRRRAPLVSRAGRMYYPTLSPGEALEGWLRRHRTSLRRAWRRVRRGANG